MQMTQIGTQFQSTDCKFTERNGTININIYLLFLTRLPTFFNNAIKLQEHALGAAALLGTEQYGSAPTSGGLH
eukprot:3145805-Amphidinium_carterae.1